MAEVQDRHRKASRAYEEPMAESACLSDEMEVLAQALADQEADSYLDLRTFVEDVAAGLCQCPRDKRWRCVSCKAGALLNPKKDDDGE